MAIINMTSLLTLWPCHSVLCAIVDPSLASCCSNTRSGEWDCSLIYIKENIAEVVLAIGHLCCKTVAKEELQSMDTADT